MELQERQKSTRKGKYIGVYKGILIVKEKGCTAYNIYSNKINDNSNGIKY